MAGQFAKPRSAPTETIGGVTLPVLSRRHRQRRRISTRRAARPIRCACWRRTASPRSRSTCSRPIRAAAYADLSEIHRAARRRLGLGFEHATPQGDIAQPVEMFTSHEALLLNYEQALTRWDELTESWWATLGAHDLDRRAHPPARRRPCRIMPRHRQHDRPQMRADAGAGRTAAADRAARSRRTGPAGSC